MIRTEAEYRKALLSLEEAVGQIPQKLTADPAYQREFLLCQANRRRFMPGDQRDEIGFFRGIHYHRELTKLEARTDTALTLARTVAEGALDPVRRPDQPYLFCSFHLGPFMQLGPYLNRQGFRLGVLTESGIRTDQLHLQAASDRLRIIDANAPDSLIDMMSQLQEGISLVAFFDGGEGVHDCRNRETLLPVTLMDRPYYCRKGLFYLSYVTRTPIVPVVSWREGQTLKLSFGEAIVPDRSLSRTGFIETAARQAFDWATPFIRAYPEQFALWHNLHRFTDLPAAEPAPTWPGEHTATIRVRFNEERFRVFSGEASHFLFDDATCQCFNISPALAKWLAWLQQQQGEQWDRLQSGVKPSLLTDLLNKQILRPSLN